jgi:hypothetical protein
MTVPGDFCRKIFFAAIRPLRRRALAGSGRAARAGAGRVSGGSACARRPWQPCPGAFPHDEQVPPASGLRACARRAAPGLAASRRAAHQTPTTPPMQRVEPVRIDQLPQQLHKVLPVTRLLKDLPPLYATRRDVAPSTSHIASQMPCPAQHRATCRPASSIPKCS